MSENQSFTPPSFPLAAYRQRTAALTIAGGGVVTGSFQNFDTRFMRDALGRLGECLRANASVNPDALMFGSDLPTQRARRPFEPNDMALIRASIDPALEREVLFDNAVAFYRPRAAAPMPSR